MKPPIVKPPIVKPSVVQPIPKQGLTRYLREQHNVKKVQDITKQNYPWIAYGSEGKPTLYGNTALHKELNLGPEYRVIKTNSGVIHKAYDAEKVNPKFFQLHDTGHVEDH